MRPVATATAVLAMPTGLAVARRLAAAWMTGMAYRAQHVRALSPTLAHEEVVIHGRLALTAANDRRNMF